VSSGGLTPGDPLGGGSERPAPPREQPAWAPPAAPETPASGYTSPPPPGAGGPAWGGSTAPVAGRWMLAGWWRRAGAQLIDGLIVGAGAFVLLFAITAPFSIGFFASDSAGVVSIVVGLIFAILCISIVALLYAPAMMARTNGKTFGRMVTGIRVVRVNGQPVTFGFAFIREVLVKVLLFSILPAVAHLVDVLWPLWDEENRALHDFIVNTRVVMD
jgi:uncharacterized RDD family membrane protein YckC